MDVHYPAVTVQLVGTDGNALAILGRVKRALAQGGASQTDIDLFMTEATSGDYDHLLATAMKWVNVE